MIFILINKATCLYQGQQLGATDLREQDWWHSEELPMGQVDVTDDPRAESEDWKVLPRSCQDLELRSLVLFENMALRYYNRVFGSLKYALFNDSTIVLKCKLGRTTYHTFSPCGLKSILVDQLLILALIKAYGFPFWKFSFQVILTEHRFLK